MKKAAIICFCLGFLVGINLILRDFFSIKLIPLSSLVQLICMIAFGSIAIILNAMSYTQDTYGTPKGNLLYWLGATLGIFGLGLFILASKVGGGVIILLGLILIVIGIGKNESPQKDKDKLID